MRSTFIVGFPGETEAEFEELLAFLREAKLDRVGCFAYSPVEGARANALPDSVPDEVKEDRRKRFMATQARISRARLKRKVGTVQQVLIDGMDESGEFAVGRTRGDAPEIDGIVRVRAHPLAAGEFVDVRITASDQHDLEGELVEP